MKETGHGKASRDRHGKPWEVSEGDRREQNLDNCSCKHCCHVEYCGTGYGDITIKRL